MESRANPAGGERPSPADFRRPSAALLAAFFPLLMAGACGGDVAGGARNGGSSGADGGIGSGGSDGDRTGGGNAGGTTGGGSETSGSSGGSGAATTSGGVSGGSSDAGSSANASSSGNTGDAGSAAAGGAGSLDAAQTPMEGGVAPVEAGPPACPGVVAGTPEGLGLHNCGECPNDRCVPNALITEGGSGSFPSCGTDKTCLPASYITPGGQLTPTPCRAVAGAEGRCSTICLSDVADMAPMLEQGDCGSDELCAPCFNPIDGEPTSACSQGCDTGPSEPPVLFEDCGAGRGKCVPKIVASPDMKFFAFFAQDTCPPDWRCLATEKVRDPAYKYPSCGPMTTVWDTGACLPAYLLADATESQRSARVLEGDDCQPDELCVRCTNGSLDTGSCS